MTKQCSKCKVDKNIDEFSNQRTTKDGKHSWCKACVYAQQRQKRATEREKREQSRSELLEAGLKVCCMCKQARPLGEFSVARKHRDGKASRCKPCDREYKQKHYIKNKERIDATNKAWYERNRGSEIEKNRERYKNNRDRHLEYFARYREENLEAIKLRRKETYKRNRERILSDQAEQRRRDPEGFKAQCKKYYWSNRESCLEKAKEYREKNREKINGYHRRRRRECPQYNITIKTRNYINQALRRAVDGTRKADSTIRLLGCSFAEFRVHIERQFSRGMTWGKVVNGEIHLDHIRPISSFDLTDPEQQAEAFHYLNVRPMWAKDNMSKKAKLTHLV